METKTFGELLKQAMLFNHISVKKLSELTRINPSTIYRYINNEIQPDVNRLKLLCVELHVSADYLLGFKPLPLYTIELKEV